MLPSEQGHCQKNRLGLATLPSTSSLLNRKSVNPFLKKDDRSNYDFHFDPIGTDSIPARRTGSYIPLVCFGLSLCHTSQQAHQSLCKSRQVLRPVSTAHCSL